MPKKKPKNITKMPDLDLARAIDVLFGRKKPNFAANKKKKGKK